MNKTSIRTAFIWNRNNLKCHFTSIECILTELKYTFLDYIFFLNLTLIFEIAVCIEKKVFCYSVVSILW